MIRKANTEDRFEIAELTYMIWQDMGLEIVQKNDKSQVINAIERSQIDVHYRNHLSHIWVYEKNQRVAGMIVVYYGDKEYEYEQQWRHLELEDSMVLQEETPLPIMEANKGDMYIESVATFPEFRGQGIATELMQHILKSDHPTKWGLNCDVENQKAFALYQKLGFTVQESKMLYGHEYYYMIYHN
ncbi:GNAT family N-acetyltransferase [Staphylococcus canis]|uniref:GNAT family N-acetyltransferase n=1 Tax=Staphylococcus canis TaxID=2724942 RepID=A0ABS0TB71_9STAP|nr:GNAT family N-acetyltransferase [Staphylococcus canis]MBI5975963.1 GNAT family N-acetyltransferase [Staphylococcus canis]